MKLWTTTIQAIDPIDGHMKTWAGPNIKGITMQDAKIRSWKQGLGYCKITGQLISIIPTKEGILPDWDKQEDYDNLN